MTEKVTLNKDQKEVIERDGKNIINTMSTLLEWVKEDSLNDEMRETLLNIIDSYVKTIKETVGFTGKESESMKELSQSVGQEQTKVNDITMTIREHNLYRNLERQIDKIFGTNKRQARNGNERYKNSCKIFAIHLSKNYSSQNFRNIRDKHIQSFIQERKENVIDAITMRNDLSAIRKLHSMIDAKHELPNNVELNLPE